jgi:hypothetical protein
VVNLFLQLFFLEVIFDQGPRALGTLTKRAPLVSQPHFSLFVETCCHTCTGRQDALSAIGLCCGSVPGSAQLLNRRHQTLWDSLGRSAPLYDPQLALHALCVAQKAPYHYLFGKKPFLNPAHLINAKSVNRGFLCLETTSKSCCLLKSCQ